MADTMRHYLIQALRRLLGDKLYMRDLEVLFNKMELTAEEENTLKYLVADLNSMKGDLNTLEAKLKRKW